MTLAQIMKTALKMLDEPPEDMSEYDELFRLYANDGYQRAVGTYVCPREMRRLTTDANGRIDLHGTGIRRIIRLEDDALHCSVFFRPEEDGCGVSTVMPGRQLTALCVVRWPDLVQDSDEPRLPSFAHPALADYICYRHLSSGSMVKQKRAQAFYAQYVSAMQRLSADSPRGTHRHRNLYAATAMKPL
ncbi:MAG: hypothetical protein J6K32_02535 [Clostridia bacterium]|nr:hypothetical protein [Clostridia bacterium]